MRLHELFTESKAQVCTDSADSDRYVDRDTHSPDTPESIRKNLERMAQSLNLEVVDGFDDYTEVKPKKTDGAKSPLTQTPGK